jgi:hypothetical protein
MLVPYRPLVNDNVLYHSLLGLASGERFLGPLVRNGRFPGAWADLLVGRAVLNSYRFSLIRQR